MNKKIIAILLSALMLIFSACGALSNAKVSTIYIDKKGKVTSATIESLPAEQYNEDALKESIDVAIAAYNQGQDTEKIELDSFKVKKEQATLRMTYASAKDYEIFNERVLFVGTLAEANAAGYDFQDEFVDAKTASIKGTTLLKDAPDKMVIITNEPVQIQTIQDILYTSDNATIIDKKTAQVEAEAGSTDNGIAFGNSANAYIIYGEQD